MGRCPLAVDRGEKVEYGMVWHRIGCNAGASDRSRLHCATTTRDIAPSTEPV